ncbi:MAG: histidine kinase [Alphaproteobacteria bacterium]|nr:histidine kinase [Alphaproteobacteria bacterium]
MRLRDYTPRGYNARHILILIVPMIVFVIAMTLFFFNTHVEQVNTRLSRSFASELALADSRRLADPAGWEAYSDDVRKHGLMDVRFSTDEALRAPPPGRPCCKQLHDELAGALRRPFSYAFQPATDAVEVRVSDPKGTLVARIDRKRVVIVTAPQFIVWSIGFSLLLLATSYAFLRNQVRSMIQLANAADAFGRGEDLPNYKPSGAREVRQAAHSVIRMRNRIRRFIDQRTAMLAGVSHDLRTPLTRLKLELALLPPGSDMKAAKDDIAEMERMLDGYLAFARGEEAEPAVDTDLSELAREAVGHLGERVQLEIDAPSTIVMRVRPLALKRAVSNLANNAADYGGRVRIRVTRDAVSGSILIEDDGPGIPENQHEDAFRPFSRLDAARNQNVSGVGLGLTIARDAARAHGGDVTLGRSDLGGLRATIRLPFGAAPARESD